MANMVLCLCEIIIEVIGMVEGKNKPIKGKNCLNLQLSYEITDKYLNTSNFVKYRFNLSFEEIVNSLYSWAKKNNFKDMWKINNMLEIPKKISQFEPWAFLEFNNGNFYTYGTISKGSLEKIKYMLLGNIYDFIKENKVQLNINENYEYTNSIVGIDEIKVHEKLVKAKIILDICSKPFMYDNKEYKFLPCHNPNGGLEAVTEVISYTVDDEYYENGNLKSKGNTYKISYVIKPNLVNYSGKMYFEPDIVVRRYVDNAVNSENLGTQFRKNRVINIKHTLYIKKEDRYITIRIAKNDKYDENNEYSFPIRFYYKDFVLENCLATKEQIKLKDVVQALTHKSKNDDILLGYHTSMDDDISTGIGSGAHANDKVLIHKHILSCCKGAIHLPPFRIVPFKYDDYLKFREKKKITSTAIDEGKIDFNKIRIKKDVDNLNLYIFKTAQQLPKENTDAKEIESHEGISAEDEASLCSEEDNFKVKKTLDITKYIDEFFQYPTIVLADIENTNFSSEETKNTKINKNIKKIDTLKKSKLLTTKVDEVTYLLHLQNKDLVLNIIEIEDKDIVSRKKTESETSIERANIIKSKLGSFKENSVALIELKQENARIDAKGIIRDALNKMGIVNQFIIPIGSTSKMNNKTRASLLDLFNDFGFTNSNIKLGDKVIYSFGYIDLNPNEKEIYEEAKNETTSDKTCKSRQVISFVIRMDDDTIEVQPILEQYTEQWFHISEINNILYKIKKQRATSLNIPFKTDEEILEEIRSVIEEDERSKIVIISHQLKQPEELTARMFLSLMNASIVQTSISKTELAQINEETDKTGILKCIYRLNDLYYRSVGEKVIGMKPNANEFKYDDFTKEYKYRNLFDIKIVKSDMDNDILASIIHNLRNTVTTKVHLNTDILTEHVFSFGKHLF